MSLNRCQVKRKKRSVLEKIEEIMVNKTKKKQEKLTRVRAIVGVKNLEAIDEQLKRIKVASVKGDVSRNSFYFFIPFEF